MGSQPCGLASTPNTICPILLGGVHAAAGRVGHLPKLGFVAEGCGGSFYRVGVVLSLCHKITSTTRHGTYLDVAARPRHAAHGYYQSDARAVRDSRDHRYPIRVTVRRAVRIVGFTATGSRGGPRDWKSQPPRSPPAFWARR